jgi:hypothetical protein
MPEFTLKETAEWSPSCCFMCGTHAGPFIDMRRNRMNVLTAEGMREMVGHVYLCVGSEERPGCVMQMARAAGCLDPGVAATLRDEVVVANARAAKLEGELEDAIANRVVKVSDVVDLVAERAGIAAS